MDTLLDHPAFRADFARLAAVTLDPARHTAPDARAHSLRVARRAGALADANGCSPEERARLVALGYAHDIGKTAGTTAPAKSVELLARYGVTDARFVELVRYHDTNLPWFLAARRGEPPTDKAWRKLAARVDVRLLALFMVADRVDCPGGWRANAPLAWFLDEARRRGLLATALAFDVAHEPEECAGAALVRGSADAPREVLLVKLRAHGYELPKGHLEPCESPRAAAVRELCEETGLRAAPPADASLGVVTYALPQAAGDPAHPATKRVEYFRVAGTGALAWDAPPRGTRELAWVSAAALPALPLVNESLRVVIARALGHRDAVATSR